MYKYMNGTDVSVQSCLYTFIYTFINAYIYIYIYLYIYINICICVFFSFIYLDNIWINTYLFFIIVDIFLHLWLYGWSICKPMAQIFLHPRL
jgi:hypothetical protein